MDSYRRRGTMRGPKARREDEGRKSQTLLVRALVRVTARVKVVTPEYRKVQMRICFDKTSVMCAYLRQSAVMQQRPEAMRVDVLRLARSVDSLCDEEARLTEEMGTACLRSQRAART